MAIKRINQRMAARSSDIVRISHNIQMHNLCGALMRIQLVTEWV